MHRIIDIKSYNNYLDHRPPIIASVSNKHIVHIRPIRSSYKIINAAVGF